MAKVILSRVVIIITIVTIIIIIIIIKIVTSVTAMNVYKANPPLSRSALVHKIPSTLVPTTMATTVIEVQGSR